MSVIDLLFEGYKKHSNRADLDAYPDRAKLCLEAAVQMVEEETGLTLDRREFTENFYAMSVPIVYTPKRQPFVSLTSLKMQGWYEITPLFLKTPSGITRLYIATRGIFELTYKAGYIDPDLPSLGAVPSDLLELIYYISEWLFVRWDSGLIGTETRTNLATLKVAGDLDPYIKQKLDYFKLLTC